MKCLFGMVAAVLFASCGLTMGQGADTTYVRIYHMIQEADGLRDRGQDEQAVAKYREAKRELENFQKIYSSWHENIVKYRLNYIESRLSALAPTMPKTEPAEVKPGAAAPGTGAEAAEALKSLQSQIEALEASNTLLQQKLKEALSAQPTLMDPQQLVQARERIRELEKERDLLQTTLDQKPSAAPTADASTIAAERQILEEVRKQLAQQTNANAALSQENEILKKQVEELKMAPTVTPLPSNDVGKQLALANAMVEELRATNVALRTQQILLETQLADMAKAAAERPTASPERIEILESELKASRSELKKSEKERASLDKKLATALKRLEKKSSKSELEKQLLEAQSRLDALEAEAVPYTAEELALVNQGVSTQLNLAADPSAPQERKPRELPPGAGPIINQAIQAAEKGRFDEAEAKFTEVLNQDDSNVFVLGSLGGVKMQLKKTEEAEALLNKALALDPNDPASLYYLGVLKYDQKNFDEALDALSRSAKNKPDKPETQYYLGLTLLNKGNREPAETAFRKAIQIRPTWGDAHYQLSFVYATQKPPFKELAQWHYQKAISSGTPRNFDLEKLIEGDSSAAPKP